MSQDPIGLEGGFNNSAYVSDPNQWVDPLGLQTVNFPGAKKDKNSRVKSESGQLIDRALTGMSGSVLFVPGIGVSGGVGYDGNGKYNTKVGTTVGLAIGASSTREIVSVGNQADGKYYETCVSAGAIISGQACVGYSVNGGAYSNISAGVGLGAGLEATRGHKTSHDVFAPKTKINHNQIKQNQKMIPPNAFEFNGLR